METCFNCFDQLGIKVLSRELYTGQVHWVLAQTHTYEQLFTILKDTSLQHTFVLSPTAIMADFELAVNKAIRTVFHTTEIRSCLFHFGQGLHRKYHQLDVISLVRCTKTGFLQFNRSHPVFNYVISLMSITLEYCNLSLRKLLWKWLLRLYDFSKSP